MSKKEPTIATREEVLIMLTEKAREGQTGAMIALERALRARAREEEDEVGEAIDRILRKGNRD
jgi:hypothetical protein